MGRVLTLSDGWPVSTPAESLAADDSQLALPGITWGLQQLLSVRGCPGNASPGQPVNQVTMPGV